MAVSPPGWKIPISHRQPDRMPVMEIKLFEDVYQMGFNCAVRDPQGFSDLIIPLVHADQGDNFLLSRTQGLPVV